MKTSLVSAALVAALFTGVSLVTMAYGQGGGPAAAPQAGGQNIAVIDIGVVFEKHARFKSQMDQLKVEIDGAEKSFKATAANITTKVETLKTYAPGSPDYHRAEAEAAKLTSDLQVEKQLKNRDIMERQSKIYLHAYQEVEDAVKQIAGRYNISLVIRYNSKEIDGTDPQEILRGIQRPIVFVDRQFDMTNAVIDSVNRSPTAATHGTGLH